MNSIETALKFFQDCGLFIYPSLLIMATGVAIALERFVVPATRSLANRKEVVEGSSRCCRAASGRT